MTDNHNTRWLYICVLLFPLILIGGCDNAADTADRRLTVFHAGSLAVPFQEMAEEFERDKPGVRVRLEAAGSRTCARKISELGRRCDVLASADYRVIEELLMPEHARWVIRFAGNEIGIAYTDESTGSKRINEENWHDILMREDVRIGRSDPESDPCGYRTVQVLKLAERYYSAENLAKRMLTKDLRFLRPKETDLLALLESGAVDYIFLYRSVARQHDLEYLELPEEVNLGSAERDGQYAQVEVNLSGSTPGSRISRGGEAIVYGITVPRRAPDPDLGVEFVEFVLSEAGRRIMDKHGQRSITSTYTGQYGAIPETLNQFVGEPDE